MVKGVVVYGRKMFEGEASIFPTLDAWVIQCPFMRGASQDAQCSWADNGGNVLVESRRARRTPSKRSRPK